MAERVAGPEIERLIQLLARLPGLGPRSARRAALDAGKSWGSAVADLLDVAGAGGPAELQGQRLAAQPQQALARAMQRRGIFGELEAERHRQRVLQPGARHHCGVAVGTRKPGKSGNRAIEIGEQRIDAGVRREMLRNAHRALHDVEHAVGQSRLGEPVGQQQRGQQQRDAVAARSGVGCRYICCRAERIIAGTARSMGITVE